MTDQTNGTNLPARPGVLNILKKAEDGARFEALLKYDKGQYYCGGNEVLLGTKLIAHCVGWATSWVKFQDKALMERRIYSVERNEVAPQRETLGDLDEKLWEIGFNDLPKDPWVFQNLLPMQYVDSGERMIFTTQSGGGERAIKEICYEYARRSMKNPECGQPIIKLSTGIMPSKTYGKIMRPRFDIIGWDDANLDIVHVPEEVLRKADLGDEIPF